MVVSNKDKYNTKYKFKKGTSHSLAEIAKTTGIKKSILQQVYNRGTGAWKNNIASVRVKSSGKKEKKWNKLIQAIKENQDNEDYCIWDTLEELGVSANGEACA